ncbi:hypothetical protein ASF62_12050 [Leifsonia sp. Leaf325]|nr:hypothetical protein ASF62_12050 [Leifsonia sp. Leaf325]
MATIGLDDHADAFVRIERSSGRIGVWAGVARFTLTDRTYVVESLPHVRLLAENAHGEPVLIAEIGEPVTFEPVSYTLDDNMGGGESLRAIKGAIVGQLEAAGLSSRWFEPGPSPYEIPVDGDENVFDTYYLWDVEPTAIGAS